MPASESFNVASTKVPERYTLEMLSDHVVRGTQRDAGGWTSHVVTVDFLNRIVLVLAGGDAKGAMAFPFSQYDAGSIEWHYNQMQAVGRNPRAPDGVLDKPAAPAAKTNGLAL